MSKLILMSPPDMIGLAEKEDYHMDLMQKSRQIVSNRRENELLPGKIWDGYYISAATYLDMGTRDNPVDVFNTYDKNKPSILMEIKIPIFAFLGERDEATIMPPQEALEIIKAKAVNAPSFDTDVIERAPHSYFGREKIMVDKIVKWLNK